MFITRTLFAAYRRGRAAPKVGYLETSKQLLSARIAKDVLESADRDSSDESVRFYIRGVATAIIGDGC